MVAGHVVGSLTSVREVTLFGLLDRQCLISSHLVAEFEETVYCRPAVATAVASEMQPKLFVGRYLGHHARTGSILIMTIDGVAKAAGFRRMNEKNRWNVDSWNGLCGVPWDVTERGAEAAGAIQAPRPQIIHLPSAPRRRYVTRADLRKYGETIGCSACADICYCCSWEDIKTSHRRVSNKCWRANGARS